MVENIKASPNSIRDLNVFSYLTFGFVAETEKKFIGHAVLLQKDRNNGYKNFSENQRWVIFLMKEAGQFYRNKQKLNGDLIIILVFH